MNLSNLEELGCLSSALLSLRNLQTLVVDLSGCGQVSIEARMELHQSIKSLKRLRGSLDSWINIEGLPDEIWFPHFTHLAFGAIKSLCSCRFIWQMRRLSTRQLPVNSLYRQATRFGRSIASSDDSAAESESMDHSIEQRMFDENRPFPCSHPACIFFILLNEVIVRGTAGWASATEFALQQILGARMWSWLYSFSRKQW